MFISGQARPLGDVSVQSESEDIGKSRLALHVDADHAQPYGIFW